MTRKKSISHRERIDSLLAGDSVDQQPIAFWRHFPLDDQSSERLAMATINFQKTFDLDLIKVSPSSSFCIRDWGIEDEWTGNTEGTRDYLSSLSVDRLSSLTIQDPKTGALGNILKAISIVAESQLNKTPIIQTIFSPLAQLKNILGKQNLNHEIRHHPSQVNDVLEIISESTGNFMEACIELNIDGFFYAVQHANSDAMSFDEFQSFGKHYDERLFPIIEKTKLNMLHIHGSHIYFETMLDYPCQIINWHDRDTPPSLYSAAQFTNKIFCGGISRLQTMVKGTQDQIKSQIRDASEQVGNKNFIIGTGCVLPIITPYGNIKFAVEYARSH